MDTKPQRRWYQFSLRTMMIVMVLSSAAFGYWVHWSKEWIRQRHEWIENHRGGSLSFSATRVAPSGLWLFGEMGVPAMYVMTNEEKKEANRLFPESTVVLWPLDMIDTPIIPRLPLME